MGDRLEDMICDLGQEFFQQAHALMYDTLESDSKKPLYLGYKKSLTLLSVVLSLVNVKAKYKWNDKNFTSLLQVVQNILLEEKTLPNSYYQTKKILCSMGPRGRTQTRVTQRNVGCISMRILPTWLPLEEFMRGRRSSTTSLWAMIKWRSILRKFAMLMLAFLSPLKRFN